MTPTIPQEVLTVTVTYNEDTGEYSIDSTYTDIINAINSNKLICFVADGYMSTTDVRLEGSIIYAHFLDLYNQEVFYFSVDSSNTVSYQDYDIPGTDIIQPDWIASSSAAPTFIRNKPAVFQGVGNLTTSVSLNKSTNRAYGPYSISEGSHQTSPTTAIIDGVSTTIYYGTTGGDSHAEGEDTAAYGARSHSEGNKTIAYGSASHAEGYSTVASGDQSHAEGQNTVASAPSAHAEGYFSTSMSQHSHAEGSGTVAFGRSQHVFGEYNIRDVSGNRISRGAYVEIVGNGDGDISRSNARTLDWHGNEVLAGKLTVGVTPTANMDVTTKEYVDNAISNVGGLTATVSNQTLFLTM